GPTSCSHPTAPHRRSRASPTWRAGSPRTCSPCSAATSHGTPSTTPSTSRPRAGGGNCRLSTSRPRAFEARQALRSLAGPRDAPALVLAKRFPQERPEHVRLEIAAECAEDAAVGG